MAKTNDNFYDNLPINRLQLSKLLVKSNSFDAVPADWHVIITDIKGSTKAVMSGLNESVNFIATGSIVAVLIWHLKLILRFLFSLGVMGRPLLCHLHC
jgi:hypothetical protein